MGKTTVMCRRPQLVLETLIIMSAAYMAGPSTEWGRPQAFIPQEVNSHTTWSHVTDIKMSKLKYKQECGVEGYSWEGTGALSRSPACH